MKLPKRELPRYSETLPISGKTYSYRPYTVAEEKILSMAVTTESATDMVAAIKQVVSNCTDLDVNILHPTDIEWAFIKLRKTSVSSLVELTYTLPKGHCKDEELAAKCPDSVKTGINLDNIEISTDEMETVAKRVNTDEWMIELEEGISIVIAFNGETTTASEHMIYDMMKSLMVDGEVYTPDMFTPEELDDWVLENVSPLGVLKISDFFKSVPVTVAKVGAMCPNCKEKFEHEVRGVSSFLV